MTAFHQYKRLAIKVFIIFTVGKCRERAHEDQYNPASSGVHTVFINFSLASCVCHESVVMIEVQKDEVQKRQGCIESKERRQKFDER